MLYRNTRRDSIVSFIWRPTNSRKGDDIYCWIKVNCSFLAPLDLPVMPSYWLFSMVIASLHISCNNVAWITVRLEKTCLQRCFQRVHNVIGLTNSNTTWALVLMGVEQILSMEQNEISCAFITNVIPSSWYSLSIGACHDNQHTFPTSICLAPVIIVIVDQPPPYSMGL